MWILFLENLKDVANILAILKIPITEILAEQYYAEHNVTHLTAYIAWKWGKFSKILFSHEASRWVAARHLATVWFSVSVKDSFRS